MSMLISTCRVLVLLNNCSSDCREPGLSASSSDCFSNESLSRQPEEVKEEEEENDEEENDEEEDEDEEGQLGKIATDLESLKVLITLLQDSREAYTLKCKDLSDSLKPSAPEPDRYAALLVQSEKQTLRFFEQAAKLALKSLGGEDKGCEVDDSNARALANAFIQIRHPSLIAPK